MEDNCTTNTDDYTVMVTPFCNSNCIMCPSPEILRKKGKSRSIDDIINEIENIPSDVKHITITGGEPTLVGVGFFSIMKKINECLPYSPVLYLTNGRVFSIKAYSRWFVDYAKKIDTVAVPIHASNEVLHDRITQTKGSFNQTIQGLKNISISKAAIEIRVVVTMLNIKDMINITELIIGVLPRVNVVNFIALEMSGNAAKNKDYIWSDYKSSFFAVKPCVEHLMLQGIKVNLYNFPLCSVERGYWGISRQSISDYKVRFAPECDNCCVKEICGGEFAANRTGNYYKVRPIGGLG